jgi:hypothetical protein
MKKTRKIVLFMSFIFILWSCFFNETDRSCDSNIKWSCPYYCDDLSEEEINSGVSCMLK